ncbi:hypothetical protein AB0932_29155, partial [Streptomyces sp. NPDC006682]
VGATGDPTAAVTVAQSGADVSALTVTASASSTSGTGIRTGRARSCTSSGVGGVIVPCWCGAVAQRMITALNRYKGWGH